MMGVADTLERAAKLIEDGVFRSLYNAISFATGTDHKLYLDCLDAVSTRRGAYDSAAVTALRAGAAKARGET